MIKAIDAQGIAINSQFDMTKNSQAETKNYLDTIISAKIEQIAKKGFKTLIIPKDKIEINIDWHLFSKILSDNGYFYDQDPYEELIIISWKGWRS